MCYIYVSILVFLLYKYVGKLSTAVVTQSKETDSNIEPSIVAVFLLQMLLTTEIIVIICCITNLNTEGSVNVCMCACIIHFISTCFEIY
jgi:hypothetical protein